MTPGRRKGSSVVWRRRALLGGVLALVLLLGYVFWFRDSSLVAVDEVKVEGVTANREQVTAALDAAGRDMTTLHVREDDLREAVAGFPTVAAISTDAGFPGTLTVKVTERLPVGTVRTGGEEVGVAEDGLLLTGLDVSDQDLPEIEADDDRGRLDTEGVAQTEVLAAAPGELGERITASTYDIDRGGVVVELDGAPDLWFGDSSDAETKWRAAIAVLARSDGGAGVTYIDVSVPGRVVDDGA